jgi:hypothetical protein
VGVTGDGGVGFGFGSVVIGDDAPPPHPMLRANRKARNTVRVAMMIALTLSSWMDEIPQLAL